MDFEAVNTRSVQLWFFARNHFRKKKQKQMRERGAEISTVQGCLSSGSWVKDVVAFGAVHVHAVVSWNVG